MVRKRKVVAASAVTMFLCAQISSTSLALAETVPIQPSEPAPFVPSSTTNTTSGSSFETSVISTSAGSSGIVPIPATAVSPDVAALTSNATVNSGTSAINVSGLATPGLIDFGTGNFQNLGSLYLYSTSPEVSSVTISGNNLVNQGILSTVLPSSLGITNAISALSLVLNVLR